MLNISLFLLGLNVNDIIASGDFTNIASSNAADGVYTLNGSPCALTDIINTSHPDTNFDPGTDIDAGGIKPKDLGGGGSQQVSLYLKNPLLASILPGYTAVFAMNLVSFDSGGWTTSSINANEFDNPNYSVAPGFQFVWAEGDTPADLVKLFSVPAAGDSTNFSGKIGSAGIHKIAVTATDSKMVASVDGGAIVSLAEAGISVICDGYYFNVGGDLLTRLRSFAFYEVVDDADLPTLSAL